MQTKSGAILLAALMLGACANVPYVTGDSRGGFDTAVGAYGGNEFSARSAEGAITVANEVSPKSAAGPAPATASAVPAAKPAATAIVAAASAPEATPQTVFVLDANAFAAVFGARSDPVLPSAEQLLQLDSLALVANEALRIDLQNKLLACRRAGGTCRFTHR